MFGTLTTEKEVNVPASEAWKLYGTLRLAEHIVDAAIPGLINKFTVVEGDGAAGTLLELFFPSGNFLNSQRFFFKLIKQSLVYIYKFYFKARIIFFL